MEDITPDLIELITSDFKKAYNASERIKRLLTKVKQGTATYAEAQEYALEVSRLIGRSYERHISSQELPDGRMYYNIAERLIPATLDENYTLVSAYSRMVQWNLNEKANIGIEAQIPLLEQDRVDGLVELVSQAKQYDDVSDKLLSAFDTFSQSIVDRSIEKNASFHYNSGLKPKIIRRAERNCCAWCRSLAGEYEYPDVPKDVYRRHANCRCRVDYDPANGKYQNVYTKRLTPIGESDKIEERKRIGLDNIDTFRPGDQSDIIKRHVKVNQKEAVRAARLGEQHAHAGVYMDALSKNKKQLQRSIISRVAQVEHHAEKIRSPELYIPNWADKDPRYQAGLIRKWEKDMKRNAEQAEIELAVFKERFGI